MVFHTEKEAEDARGKIIFISFDNQYFGIVETKKGYSRGGHYRRIPQELYLISGKAEYREKNIETGKKDTRIVSAPIIIRVPPKTANLFIALEDSLFIETLESKDTTKNFPEFRKIVEEIMKK